MTNFHLLTSENFICISNSEYSAINRIFLVELQEYAIKEQSWKVCDARYTFNKVLGGIFHLLLKNRKY